MHTISVSTFSNITTLYSASRLVYWSSLTADDQHHDEIIISAMLRRVVMCHKFAHARAGIDVLDNLWDAASMDVCTKVLSVRIVIVSLAEGLILGMSGWIIAPLARGMAGLAFEMLAETVFNVMIVPMITSGVAVPVL